MELFWKYISGRNADTINDCIINYGSSSIFKVGINLNLHTILVTGKMDS